MLESTAALLRMKPAVTLLLSSSLCVSMIHPAFISFLGEGAQPSELMCVLSMPTCRAVLLLY